VGQIVQVASYKFGDFELDPARFELRRNGAPVKLERIPMELLILLAEKDGAVVSRQEIVDRLWGKDVFVDTEHGINTAIRKIRTALREDADRSRFLQTVPGKGYRFIPELSNGNATTPEAAPITVPPVELTVIVPAHRSRRTLAALLTATIVVAAALLVVYLRRTAHAGDGRIKSIAVLPLTNLSGDASQDYFADGMTDEIITMLAKNTSLRVVSRTSVMQYKAVGRPLRDVARELGADAILEGSVSKSGNRAHVTVQLIRAADDTHVWADSYDRDLPSVFALPAEVSSTIGKRLNAETSAKTPKKDVNPEAHDAYLRGRYFWFARNYDRALEYMKQAVQLQPDYAAAWSGLADAYTVRGVAGLAPAQEIRADIASAVHKALELDPSSAEAHHAAAAYYLFLEWNWKMADLESQRAIELNPLSAETHHLRAYILLAMNRPEEALKAQQRSTELDPFARPFALGRMYMGLRRYDAAINELQLRKDAQPKDLMTRFSLAKTYFLKGMAQQSVEQLAEAFRLTKNEKAAVEIERLFQNGGAKAVDQWLLDRDLAQAKKEYVAPLRLASDYAELGRKEETISMLEAAYNERSPQLIFLQYMPDLDFVHHDPRYRATVKKMDMSPAY
jgi:TolB-like protein/DNA-binding winged helix-turn-helix (wHTH) protein/tetratricopeptide (TPR) repeat protein